ncbi:MAG: 1-(5-phosphoribosyl)-5-[(5-phosphoribosylamino)methylideneamino]imidazole-4-carboxamide isomerase [Clostridiales bacterium]|mgnify:FL=1|jgi:phosphoribosylformimino-5-aminoimidazole carboxamide ribotide isomerase|nr:1-(5-phosphoribosyl)-5-[(5-phosphoribosylamino)methylideneamino]imidazole-4-carboxamide isomerase [Clostridiales bacterium]
MNIYPAIDIKDGKCVRLIQGDMNKATVYDEVPVRAAVKWQDIGAACLHVVDLDGAVNGKMCNTKTVEDIIKSINIPVQLGGGIRDMDTIEALLDIGVEKVILGTAALKSPDLVRQAVEKYPCNIVIGIDARDGYVAVEGWQKTSGVKALNLAKQMESLGIKTVVFTDIWRDGMLQGPNFSGIVEIIENTSLEIIASGGISRMEHLLKLKKMGASGAIVGRALYTGDISLGEAISMLKGEK